MKVEKTSRSTEWSQARLHLLSRTLSDNFEKIIRYFNLDMRQTSKMYIGTCPIHTGNNLDALNFYHSGTQDQQGNWCCNTRGCEAVFHPSALGFVRGLLSKLECGWTQKGDKIYPFMDTIAWSLKLLGIKDSSTLKVDQETIDKDRFISQSKIFNTKRPKGTYTTTRTQVRKRLDIPAKQFIDMGFSPALLDEYDVGVCTIPNKPMSDRVVFPVYEETNTFMVGCLGRSIWDRCPNCKLWHPTTIDCPPPTAYQQYAKWRNSKGFVSEYWLYNYWKAYKHIQKSGIVILVEGPKDVLRLEQADIHNSVATFGAKLSDGQKNLLDSSGAFSLILLTDPDEAGIVARETISQKCKQTYNIITPELGEDDVGATSESDLQFLLLPLLEQFKIEL